MLMQILLCHQWILFFSHQPACRCLPYILHLAIELYKHWNDMLGAIFEEQCYSFTNR